MIAVAAIVVAALSFLYWCFGSPAFPPSDGGIVSSWSGQWIASRDVNGYVGVGSCMLIGLVMVLILRRYNLIRHSTKLPAALFGYMMLATPSLLMFLYSGWILCLAVLCCLWFMMDSFAQPQCQRNVFAVFLLLSAGTAIDYGFALFLPVFWLAVAQMRVMCLRSILASLMGIVTPWIILFGFGIVQIDDLQMPVLWGEHDLPGNSQLMAMLITGAFTVFVGLCAWMQGFIKIISYNTQSRAQISMFSVVMLMSILGACIDFSHVAMFLPLLSCMVAIIVGHLFGVIFTHNRSWLAILCLILIYLGMYAWRLIVCFL